LRPDLEDVRWRGYSVRDLLHINLDQAASLFAANPRLAPTLSALNATGLGHLPLGRPTESLSSGERKRFSVSLAMARLKAAQRDPRPTLVVLDQPDAGLDDQTAATVATWMADAIRGNGTLVTVAHHPALLAAADAVAVLP
jgi:excinuclease ABC subunit A